MRVLLTGGGTAGHINPALAIAETVKQNDPSAVIEFVGIRNGKEADLIPREGYTLHFVESMGIRRSLSPANIKALWLAWRSPKSRETQKILNDFQPDIVIGTGGYASWPIMKAAVDRGIPTAVHESNAFPGLTVRRLQKQVDRIWINFPQTAASLKQKERVMQVGNPLRSGFGCISKERARRELGISENRKMILSFGGSLGAEDMNRAVIETMRDYSAKHPHLLHIHAAGKRDYEASMRLFREMGLQNAPNCMLVDYIYDMPIRMAAADVVISRAGAMTLSELALMQKAAILVPSPHVADNHQFVNAKTLADANGAELVEEATFADGRLQKTLARLVEDEAHRTKMEQSISAFADRDAAHRIWDDIKKLIQNNK